MSDISDDILNTHREHLEFLYDQRKILLDNITEEEKSRPEISRKLKRLDHKILEFELLLAATERSWNKNTSQ